MQILLGNDILVWVEGIRFFIEYSEPSHTLRPVVVNK